MRRYLHTLILLAVLLGQSVWMLGSLSVSQRVGELDHFIMHGQSENHHHHADNVLHMDEEDGSVQHLHADSGANPAGLLTSLPIAWVDVRSMSPPAISHAVWLSPTLEGPLRPPMHNA